MVTSDEVLSGVLASQRVESDGVDAIDPELVDRFCRDVLRAEVLFLSDRSSLDDFFEPKQTYWARIRNYFGVDVHPATTLLEIFRRLTPSTR